MDAHPIPQDVTNFQFKLIGDMTIKQFLYLGAGLGLAYLLFVFLSSSAPIIAWPLIILSSSLGAAFAFIPISDRPLDHWVRAYFKSVFNPTLRKLEIKGVKVDEQFLAKRLDMYFHQVTIAPAALQPIIKPLVIAKPTIAPIIKKVEPLIAPVAPPAAPLISTPAPQVAVPVPAAISPLRDLNLEQIVDVAKKAQLVQVQISETERELNEIQSQAKTGQSDPSLYMQQFSTVMDNLKNLTEQANKLQEELVKTNQIATPQLKKDFVTISPVKPTTVTTLTLTSTPNIVNGIVIDSQGNYLNGVIVVTHDKDNLPVRALRTNKLGQFIAATPLPNGTYTMSVEKDGLTFDTFKIDLNGALLPPIKISAKGATV